MVSTEPASQKVALFGHPAFFCRRTHDMIPKREVSKRVIDDTFSACADYAVVVLYAKEDEWMLSALQEKFEVFLIDRSTPVVSTKSLKRRLKELGVRFKGPRGSRLMSWANVQKFVVGDSFKSVGRDDFAAFGIKPDKELKFQDLAAQRTRDGWP